MSLITPLEECKVVLPYTSSCGILVMYSCTPNYIGNIFCISSFDQILHILEGYHFLHLYLKTDINELICF